MKKILIYLKKENLRCSAGGPYGYNYGIYKYYQNHKRNDFELFFLEENKNDRLKGWVKAFYKKYKKFLLKPYVKWKCKRAVSSKCKKSKFDFGKYDIVHFHDTLSMKLCEDSLKNYNGKVVLTSHSPKLQSDELLDDVLCVKNRNKSFYNKMVQIDLYAFNRADYIIFPCKEAVEPYMHSNELFKQIDKNNRSKYIFIPTGIEKREVKKTRSEVLHHYAIPENAFVVSFAGRHNFVKGYDDLKRFAAKILAKYENVYFLIAGKEGPLFGIDNERWIEVGWTNDAPSIIAASDVFVLPNKETYFDIVMLENLSIPQIVIANNTGGNKFIKSPGVLKYNNDDEFMSRFDTVYKMSESDKKALREENLELFQKEFDIGIFCEKYYDFLERISV